MSREQTALRTICFSIAGNTVLAALKFITGFFGNSYALIADAIESACDTFSSLLVLFGLKYASKPPDKNHPYGHGRAEPLITFAVVAILVISAVIIAHGSVTRLLGPPHEAPEPYTLVVLGIIIFWKELSYRFVRKKGEITGSVSLKADAWHHRSDAITSAAAFAGISTAILFGEGFESADDWAALLASGVILYNSYRIFRPALGEIMDEHTYDDLVESIRSVALTVDGISGTEKCLIRKVGVRYYVELHAEVDPEITVRLGHELGHRLQDVIREKIPEVAYVLVHIEPAHTS